MKAFDPVVVLNDQLIIGQHARDLQQRLFHLFREEVDTGNDQHVIPSAVDRFQFQMSSAASTFFPCDDPGKVTCPEPDHRQCLPGESRDHDLAHFAVFQHFSRIGIDDFDDIVVFPRVDPFVRTAIHTQRADAAGFRHAVNIKCFDPQSILDPFFHGCRECFRTEDPDFQIGQRSLAFIQQFHNADGIRYHTCHDPRTEILCQFDLPRRIPRTAGQHKKIRFARTVVTAEAAVEKTESGCDLADIAFFRACHDITARHTFRPLV